MILDDKIFFQWDQIFHFSIFCGKGILCTYVISSFEKYFVKTSTWGLRWLSLTLISRNFLANTGCQDKLHCFHVNLSQALMRVHKKVRTIRYTHFCSFHLIFDFQNLNFRVLKRLILGLQNTGILQVLIPVFGIKLNTTGFRYRYMALLHTSSLVKAKWKSAMSAKKCRKVLFNALCSEFHFFNRYQLGTKVHTYQYYLVVSCNHQ